MMVKTELIQVEGYNKSPEEVTSVSTCCPEMRVTFHGVGSHRYYNVWHIKAKAFLALYLKTIKQARAVAGGGDEQ